VTHKEFLAWKETPRLDRTDPFISRVYREDIDLSLNFCNAELGVKVFQAVEDGAIFIEAVTDKSKSTFPK